MVIQASCFTPQQGAFPLSALVGLEAVSRTTIRPARRPRNGIFAGAALDPAHESGLAEFLRQAHLSQVFSNLLKFIATKYTDESG